MRRHLLAAAVFGALAAPAAAQNAPALPTNDFQGLLALTGMQTPMALPVQSNAEPALEPVPETHCGAGSHPLAGEQGRVPAAATSSADAARGWTCNLTVISHHDTPGGFRVWRYVDTQGHACAFYDTSLLGPLNAISLAAGPGQGVAVLDMDDPAHPVQTALLIDPGMLSPHESLNLNAKRGLLAAETADVGTEPGILSLYDVTQDCRTPTRISNTLVGPEGHESGFSPDGNTFWIGGLQGIQAIDVSNPAAPHEILGINEWAHGLNLSDDGDTLYDTNAVDGGLTLLDVSEIQARKPDPHVYEISRLIWNSASIPQNTNPMTIGGHKYLLEFDEFALRFNPVTLNDEVGAARIISVDDPAHPHVVSNLRLAVNQRAAHIEADDDPNFVPGSQTTYSAHYCNVPREVDPEIAACSFLNSGLRVFDIRDPEHPREIAYFVSPPGTAQGQKSDAAFSQPAFDPARREVWFTDATTGFWNVRLPRRAWPHPTARCAKTRRVVFHVRRRGTVRVRVGGHRVHVRRRGHRVIARVPAGSRVRLVVRRHGHTHVRHHRIPGC